MGRGICVALAFALASARAALAQDVQAAVAANFAAAARDLAGRFARDTRHPVGISTGSTGKFYAQIRAGAPFDVFLAADDETPARLERERLAVAGSRFTYAVGRLALWSPQPDLVDDKGNVLREGRFRRLAIANPKLAPYGAAAVQALQRLGLWDAVKVRLVQGENIAQTFQFVASGNADLGFVAWSQVVEQKESGAAWLVPASLHSPLRQDATLLVHGERNAVARQFLDFLRSAQAREQIRHYGYEAP